MRKRVWRDLSNGSEIQKPREKARTANETRQPTPDDKSRRNATWDSKAKTNLTFTSDGMRERLWYNLSVREPKNRSHKEWNQKPNLGRQKYRRNATSRSKDKTNLTSTSGGMRERLWCNVSKGTKNTGAGKNGEMKGNRLLLMKWFGMDVGNNNELWRNKAQKTASSVQRLATRGAHDCFGRAHDCCGWVISRDV
jgi:hypothetical protein